MSARSYAYGSAFDSRAASILSQTRLTSQVTCRVGRAHHILASRSEWWARPNAIDLGVGPQTAMGQVVSTCPHMPEKPCLSCMQTQRAMGSRRPHRSRSSKSMALGTAHPTKLSVMFGIVHPEYQQCRWSSTSKTARRETSPSALTHAAIVCGTTLAWGDRRALSLDRIGDRCFARQR